MEGDPQTYKPKEEVEEWMKKDPIPRARKKFIEMGILTDKEADKIEQEMLEELERAVKFAEESPFPAPEETLQNVFA
jgi:pyruvate dehydrogenase E1 component alpha subunit